MDRHTDGSYFELPSRAEGDDTCLPCAIGEWAPCPACPPDYHSAYRELCDAYQRLVARAVSTTPHSPELRIE